MTEPVRDRRNSVAAFGVVKAPMARPEDLIVFKAIAGRPKDIEDTTALLVPEKYPAMTWRSGMAAAATCFFAARLSSSVASRASSSWSCAFARPGAFPYDVG